MTSGQFCDGEDVAFGLIHSSIMLSWLRVLLGERRAIAYERRRRADDDLRGFVVPMQIGDSSSR